MVSVGIRQLMEQTSKVIRHVRDEGVVVEITYYGKVVAFLVPAIPPQFDNKDISAILTDLEQLSAEISAEWPEGVSAEAAARDVRRE